MARPLDDALSDVRSAVLEQSWRAGGASGAPMVDNHCLAASVTSITLFVLVGRLQQS